MEFDVSRVYTPINANELKVGSKVIVADNFELLKYRVEHDCEIYELTGILTEDCTYRFCANFDEHALAYLVSEPGKKKLEWTDLKVGDIITDGQMECMVVTIDKSKTAILRICVITANGNDWLDDTDLGCWEKVEH